jgi:hypothetical protein
VRAEGDDPLGFHSLLSAQNLLHRGAQVVVAQSPEYAFEIRERQLVRLRKCLLGGVGVRTVKSVSRCHAPHCEELRVACFASQFRRRFEPVDLRFLAPAIALRHEHFRAFQSHLAPAQRHIPPYCLLRDRNFRALVTQPRPDAMRGMPLLARRLEIALQHPLDRLPRQIQLRLLPLAFFRPGGSALAIACRTMRRCTSCSFASCLIVFPAVYPCRIFSNSSTLALLSIPGIVSFRLQVGPIQTIKRGQM